VISKAKTVHTNCEQDWLYITSENGWTLNKIGLRWLKELFLSESAVNDPRQTRILLDSHGSHIPTGFMYECETHNVKLICLPAHSPHVLQTLDLSISSLMKDHHRKEIDIIAAYDDTGPVKKIRFIQFYSVEFEASTTRSTVRAVGHTLPTCTTQPVKDSLDWQGFSHQGPQPSNVSAPLGMPDTDTDNGNRRQRLETNERSVT
jgi:DDE superfamily endonuclease